MENDFKYIPKEQYPFRLSSWAKCPPYLWWNGDFSLFWGLFVSVIGTRNVSQAGKLRTRAIAKALVGHNVTIVSGLAEGVDTEAHAATLHYNGKTVAVMGTAIEQCFPKQNESLKEKIAAEGLIVSQFPPYSQTGRSNFPRRNEVMAAWSHMTVVVEASLNSGTRHQVTAAIKLGRPVAFLSSLAKQKYPWVTEALDSGLGFIAHNTGDILSRLNEICLNEKDSQSWLISNFTEIREQAYFDLDVEIAHKKRKRVRKNLGPISSSTAIILRKTRDLKLIKILNAIKRHFTPPRKKKAKK